MKTFIEELKDIEEFYKIDLSIGKKQEVMYFKYAVINRHRYLGVSAIGKLLGKNHSSVVHNLKAIDILFKHKNDYFLRINELSTNFNLKKLQELRHDLKLKKNKYVKKGLKEYKEKKRIEKIRAEVKMADVIPVLRLYPQNHLWNKEIIRWDNRDIIEFQRLSSIF